MQSRRRNQSGCRNAVGCNGYTLYRAAFTQQKQLGVCWRREVGEVWVGACSGEPGILPVSVVAIVATNRGFLLPSISSRKACALGLLLANRTSMGLHCFLVILYFFISKYPKPLSNLFFSESSITIFWVKPGPSVITVWYSPPSPHGSTPGSF